MIEEEKKSNVKSDVSPGKGIHTGNLVWGGSSCRCLGAACVLPILFIYIFFPPLITIVLVFGKCIWRDLGEPRIKVTKMTYPHCSQASQTRWKCILSRTWTWDQKGPTIARAIRPAQWRHHTGRSRGKAKRATGTQPNNSSQRRACSKHKHSRCVTRPGGPPETAPPERETARADLNQVGQRQKGRWGKAQVTREGNRATSSESCHSSWRHWRERWCSQLQYHH